MTRSKKSKNNCREVYFEKRQNDPQGINRNGEKRMKNWRETASHLLDESEMVTRKLFRNMALLNRDDFEETVIEEPPVDVSGAGRR